jgi:2'-5' RNA ligase
MGPGIQKIKEYLRYRRKRKAFPIQIAFVILVSDEIHNFMRGLEVELFHKYGVDRTLKDNPHISLKQGFEVDTLEPFEDYFDKLANEIQPFEIVVNGIGFFDQGIIFLDVKKDSRLETLRRRILRDLSDQYGVKPNSVEDEQYHFHATLASGLPKEDFLKARQACKDIRVEYRFVFDTLGLFYHMGDQWIIYKRSNISRAAKTDSETAGA